jgi:pimeloyl-ACP methyl ester carboxylesterase
MVTGVAGSPEVAAYPGVRLPDWAAVEGHATGLPLSGSMLLVHGAGAERTQLVPLGEALAQRGMTAAYPSLRRHGESPAPAWGYSPLEFAADLHRIGDALPGDLHLVGYSLGGLVVTVCAVTWAAARIRSLVLIDAAFAPAPQRHEVDDWAEGSFLRWHWDYRPMLALAGVPTLYLTGARSDAVSEAERRWAAGLPRLTCRTVPGTHAELHRPTPDLLEAVSAFYAGLPG